ncbi:hypothetical protein LZQ00_12355 [Sphingobacterium sp. SRCM116780]|uniref:hypothetical protein n=1 Tax=Sphingobacterium sp. SRCM116780 TaxID=2907623 RepID=UPI001F21E0AC|nr:hypothetical protein [Sphingobacterium sp. SRCM116780]UIR55071.1 hypothetical protein LZQ00_12355 [Sphingobacterium sp. SRCM116780]
MGTENSKPLSILERMKQKAQEQQTYGGKQEDRPANMKAKDCPNCGAGRAQDDGLTHCAFCGFKFMTVKLTDGIHIKKEDNSNN